MRTILISLLLASALAPAIADARDGRPDREPRDRPERSSNADEDRVVPPQRPERVERASRPQRSEPRDTSSRSNRLAVENGRADRKLERATATKPRGSIERVDRQEQSQRIDRTPRPDRRPRANVEDRAARPVPVQEVADTPDVRTRRPTSMQPPVQPARRAQGGSDSMLDGFRRIARDETSRPDNDDHDGRDRDHDGHDRDHNGRDGHDGDHDRDWSKDWRKDHRYDWWDYRNRYRSIYRLGRYHDPYGWGYRRWSIGYNLWPSHYGSGYWLNDPWMYRLPPAYGPYRWVRYYDDALLVNVYTGQVIDVVYNFFW